MPVNRDVGGKSERSGRLNEIHLRWCYGGIVECALIQMLRGFFFFFKS